MKKIVTFLILSSFFVGFSQTKTIQLNEVVIELPKMTKEVEVGGARRKAFWHHNSGTNFIFCKHFEFKSEYKQTKFIKNVVVFTKSRIKKATFKIFVYAANDDGSPGEELTKNGLIVETKKGNQKNYIDVSYLQLRFPESGIFVGYQWILDEANKVEEENYYDGFKNVNKLTYGYQPYLILNPADIDFTYRFFDNKWQKTQRFKNSNINLIEGKCNEPAINLVLTN